MDNDDPLSPLPIDRLTALDLRPGDALVIRIVGLRQFAMHASGAGARVEEMRLGWEKLAERAGFKVGVLLLDAGDSIEVLRKTPDEHAAVS